MYIHTHTHTQHLSEVRSSTGQLSLVPEVSRLVDYVWTEATDQLEDVLAVAVGTITLDQLDKAEAALLSIRREMDGDNDRTSEGQPFIRPCYMHIMYTC